MTFSSLLIFLMIAEVGALLIGEWRRVRPVIWISKITASTIFLVYAVSLGAFTDAYGRWVFLALVLSWVGDVFLLRSDSKAFFQYGLASFLCAHIAYGAAFFPLGDAFAGALALGIVSVVGFFVARWLMPSVKAQDPKMAAPVWAYMVVISVMLSLAAAAAFGKGGVWMLAGAVVFYLSDISVARDRFVRPGLANKLWGLPFYYAAQMILASTIARGAL